MKFTDCQQVQNIRRRLFRTLAVLDESIEVALGCEMHCCELERKRLMDQCGMLLSELEAYSSMMKRHRADVAALLEYSSGTSALVRLVLIISGFPSG